MSPVLRSAHILKACVVALLVLGVLMVRSASLSVLPTDGAGVTRGAGGWADPTGGWLNRHLLYAVLALAAMGLGSRIDLAAVGRARWWRSPVLLALLGALVLCGLTLVPGIARNVNGASRWLVVGPPGRGVSFQPSELVKWVMIATVAWWCTRRGGAMHRFWRGLVPALAVLAVACGLIVIEDLGTAALIAAVAVVLLVAGGARLWQVALIVPVGVAGAVTAILHSPYRVRRLTAFLDPWADPAGTGYHPIHSMLAFAQGGPGGAGLGDSIQKYYIPEDTTDFVFPILAEELGFAGAALVVALFLTILWVGYGVCRDSRDPFGRLVGLGVLLTLGLQAAINLAVVTVVVPTKGIALPFVSAGGTGWVMTGLAVGLVASLDREPALDPATDRAVTPSGASPRRALSPGSPRAAGPS